MAILSSPIHLLQSIPLVTRLFAASTLAFSSLYGWLCWKGLASEAFQYMTLIPGSAMFQPWTLITSLFVETTAFELIASLLFVPPSLRYLERLWGSIETAKFIAVSVFFSNLMAFSFNWMEYFATKNADLYLYGMRYHGQMAIQIAILVAFTQLIPEHHIQVFGFLKARVKTLPMSYLALSTVLCMLGWQCPWIVIQFGWFVSWIYLRFYKRNTNENLSGGVTYGDRSDTFSLVSWFPPFLHKPLTVLGNSIFSFANYLHLIPEVEASSYTQLPGTARAEAERRRALALKALDQRLATSSSPPTASSGSQPVQTSPKSSRSTSLDQELSATTDSHQVQNADT